MVDVLLVDDEEAVVGVFEFFHRYGGVLLVVFFEVEGKLPGNRLGVDCGGDILFAFGEQGEDGVVDVVINQDEAFVGLADEVGHEGMGVVHLTIVENALLGWFGGFEGLKDFFEMGVGFGLELELALFDGINAGKDIGIGVEKMPHLNEGIYNLDAYFYRSLASEDGGEHGDALLGEDVGEIFPVLPATLTT